MIDDRNATKPRNVSFKQYKNIKRQMLCDFCVYEKLTKEEEKRFKSLATEIEVDQFCISMINKYL